VLHSRKKRAATYDRARGVEIVDVFEKGIGNVARLADGGWFAFEPVNLSEVGDVLVRFAPLVPGSVEGEFRLDSPEGPRLGTLRLDAPTVAAGAGVFVEQRVSLGGQQGVHTLVFVARRTSPTTASRVLDVQWLTFDPPAPRS
jgi:hypothetical protein